MWREATGKVAFSRRLERAFDCIFGIKNKNQEIWACTGLIHKEALGGYRFLR